MVTKNNNKISKIKADAYDLLKEEVSKLSGLKKILFDTVFSRLLDILSEDCSENDVAQAINSIEKVNSEYVREDDFHLPSRGPQKRTGQERPQKAGALPENRLLI